MSDKPKTGRRVQIYLPADLLEQWDATPRYERSATVAAALRHWFDGGRMDALRAQAVAVDEKWRAVRSSVRSEPTSNTQNATQEGATDDK